MSDQVDELPEIQIEEVLDEGKPAVAAAAAPTPDAFDIDIDLDDDPLPTAASAAPLPPPGPPPPGSEPALDVGAVVVDAATSPAMDRRDTAVTPELTAADTEGVDLELDAEPDASKQHADYEPQFDLDTDLGSLSVDTDHDGSAAPEPAIDMGLDAEGATADAGAPELDLGGAEPELTFEPVAEALDMPEPASAELSPADPEPEPETNAAEPEAAEVPVLPAAFDAREPEPSGGAPAVSPPSANAMDIDAMLGDLDLGLPPDAGAATPPGESIEEAETAGEPAEAPAAEAASEPAEEPTAETAGEPTEDPTAGPAVSDELAAALEDAAGATAEEAEDAPVHDLAEEMGLHEEEADASEAPLPSAPEFEEEAAEEPSPLEASMASAADEDGAPEPEVDAPAPLDDAPMLPIGEEEPPPISSISPAMLTPDENTLAALKKLAGPSTTPDETRTALYAALKGEAYDPHALPDARALILGLARVLVSTGYSPNEIVDAIMHAMSE